MFGFAQGGPLTQSKDHIPYLEVESTVIQHCDVNMVNLHWGDPQNVEPTLV